MLVDITDKGEKFLDKVRKGGLDQSTDDRAYDYMILSTLSFKGEEEVAEVIDVDKYHIEPKHAGPIKNSFRRLFEAGHIEQVE